MTKINVPDAFEAELAALEKPFTDAGYFPNTQLVRVLGENDGDPIQWALSIGTRQPGQARHFRGATIGECLRKASAAMRWVSVGDDRVR